MAARRRATGWRRAGLPGLCALTALLAAAFCLPAHAQQKAEAYILRLDSPINATTVSAIEERINQAVKDGVRTFILELDTPGGYLDDSIELGDFIFKQDSIDVIAYVHNRAYSGGAMVALACRAIYIDSVLGRIGDVAPVNEAGQIMNEKAQTVVREVMTNYARARGYPQALVQAMVTKELEAFRVQMSDEPPGSYTYMTGAEMTALTEQERQKIVPGSRKLIVAAGQLLTMNPEEAVQYGFARKAVRDPQELYEVLGVKSELVRRVYPSMTGRVLSVLDAFTPLLIVAGFVLLFMELIHPGFGLPGILGIACFVAFFLIKISLHYAGAVEVLLFVAGLVLLLVEILFIPGFGVVGILGIVMMFVGLVLAFQRFGLPRTPEEIVTFQYSLVKVIASLAASAVGIGIVVRMVPSMPGLRRIMNVYNSPATIGDMQEARTPGLANMMGDVGVALTPLRPAGRADFGDVRLDVVTEGDFIEKGQSVRIEAIQGNRIVVSLYREA